MEAPVRAAVDDAKKRITDASRASLQRRDGTRSYKLFEEIYEKLRDLQQRGYSAKHRVEADASRCGC
jgi:hypothetical protein